MELLPHSTWPALKTKTVHVLYLLWTHENFDFIPWKQLQATPRIDFHNRQQCSVYSVQYTVMIQFRMFRMYVFFRLWAHDQQPLVQARARRIPFLRHLKYNMNDDVISPVFSPSFVILSITDECWADHNPAMRPLTEVWSNQSISRNSLRKNKSFCT